MTTFLLHPLPDADLGADVNSQGEVERPCGQAAVMTWSTAPLAPSPNNCPGGKLGNPPTFKLVNPPTFPPAPTLYPYSIGDAVNEIGADVKDGDMTSQQD